MRRGTRFNIFILLILLLFVVPGNAFTQNDRQSLTESLNKADKLSEKSPEEALKLLKDILIRANTTSTKDIKADALKLLGIIHYYEMNNRQSQECFEQALIIYRELENQDGIASVLNNSGLLYERQGDLSRALKRYNEAAVIMSDLPGSRRKLTFVLANIGNVYYTLGRFDKALDFLSQALKNSENVNDSAGMAMSYNNIGNIYLSLKEFNTAVKMFSRSEKLRIALRDDHKLPTIYNNLGQAYLGLNNIDEALKYNKLSLEIANKHNDNEGVISSLINISEIYTRINEFETAMNNYKEALRLSNPNPDRFLYASILKGIAELKLKQDEYDEAITSFKEAMNLIEKTGSDLLLQDIYSGLSAAWRAKGNYEKAYTFLMKHKEVVDSIYNRESISRLNMIRVSFELEQTERDNQLLRQQNIFSQLAIKRQQTIRNLLIIITAIVLVSLAFLVLLYHSIKKKNELLVLSNQQISRQKEELDKLYLEQYKLNETKNKFFSIIAHDLKSPFQSLLGFSELLSIEYEHFTDAQRLEAINNMYKVTTDTYKFIENLLEWGRIQTGNTNVTFTRVNIKDFVSNILPLYDIPMKSKNLSITVEIPSALSANADPNILGAVFRNLLSNAIKFSYPDGSIYIKGIPTIDSVRLSVTDNGIGISQDLIDKLFTFDPKIRRNGTKGETGTGMGLGLCMELMQLNNGIIKVTSLPGEGSTFTMVMQPGVKTTNQPSQALPSIV